MEMKGFLFITKVVQAVRTFLINKMLRQDAIPFIQGGKTMSVPYNHKVIEKMAESLG